MEAKNKYHPIYIGDLDQKDDSHHVWHDDSASYCTMSMDQLNKNMAVRLELIASFLGGEDVYDDDGNKTGEKTPQLITVEEAKELLNFKDARTKD